MRAGSCSCVTYTTHRWRGWTCLIPVGRPIGASRWHHHRVRNGMLYYKVALVTRANQVEIRTNVVGSGSMGVRAWGSGSVAWKDGDLRHLAEEGTCQAVACIVALERGNSQRQARNVRHNAKRTWHLWHRRPSIHSWPMGWLSLSNRSTTTHVVRLVACQGGKALAA